MRGWKAQVKEIRKQEGLENSQSLLFNWKEVVSLRSSSKTSKEVRVREDNRWKEGK